MPGKHIVAIIGPKNAGKSQLHTRLIGKKAFSEEYVLKTGAQIDQKQYTFDDKDLTVQYWDFGPDLDAGAINTYLRKAHKICLTFDATDPNCIQTLEQFISTNEIALPESTPIVLVGTQYDKISEQTPGLSTTVTGYAKARFRNAPFISVSSKTDANLDNLSQTILSDLPTLVDQIQPSNLTTRNDSVVKLLHTMVENNNWDINGLIDAVTSASETDLNDSRVQQLITHVSSPKRHTPAEKTSLLSSSSRKLEDVFEQQSSENSETKPHAEPKSSTTSENISTNVPHTDSCFSFTLRLIGMALMLAALTSLIYLVLLAASVMSALAFTTVVNHIVVTVGGLLGANAPLAAFSSACASVGLSTTAASSLVAAGVSLATMGLGYGMFRCGKQPPVESVEPQQASSCCFA